MPMEDIDKAAEKLRSDDEDLLLAEVVCGDCELLYIDTLLRETLGAK